MPPASVLYFLLGLSLGFVRAHGDHMGLTSRQEELAAADNSFRFIQPSKVLEWTSCYANSSASDPGLVSCARLLVCPGS